MIETNKSLAEIKSCYHATEQDLKSLRQDKSNLEEELEELRRAHAEEMEDLGMYLFCEVFFFVETKL